MGISGSAEPLGKFEERKILHLKPLTMSDKAKAPAPGSPDFDAATAGVEALEEHVRILTARKQLADLGAAPAAPATFTAPSAPLVAKHDSTTNLVQHLPQVLWDKLSEEDLARFTPAGAEKPADLPKA